MTGFYAVEQQDWEALSKCVSDDWSIYNHRGYKWNLEHMRDFFTKNKIKNLNFQKEVILPGLLLTRIPP